MRLPKNYLSPFTALGCGQPPFCLAPASPTGSLEVLRSAQWWVQECTWKHLAPAWHSGGLGCYLGA